MPAPDYHDTLRADLLMQTAVGRDQVLASASTLSRLETGATRADACALHQVLVEHFITSFATPPKELILDVDASDVPLHDEQELKQFHGYYDHHCYFPCMCSAASRCSFACCCPAVLMVPNMRWRCYSCWLTVCARYGPKYGFSFGVTPAFVVSG